MVGEDEILVGEPGNLSRPGIVYRRDAEGWVEHARLRASDAVEDVGFGAALASDDSTLLIGAYGRGAAYVFHRQADGSWTESARLVAADALERSGFCRSVAISAGTALVGASGASGTTYVFARDERGSWTQQARLDPGDGAEHDRFGTPAVAVRGDRAFVGMPGRSERTGEVRQYRRESGEWREVGALRVDELPKNALFGSSLLLRDDELLVGAPEPDSVGTVFSFRPSPEDVEWRPASRLLPFGATQGERFGVALAYGDELFIVTPPIFVHCVPAGCGKEDRDS